MATFPAAKLGALLLKQISKPVANACRKKAISSPFFRQYICMPPAQLYHWSEVQLKMWVLNLGKPVNIPVLNENQAIALGASLLGEGVIFSIAALIIISEYRRSSAKEAKKDAVIQSEKLKLEQNLQELFFITQKQATQINELMRHICELEGRAVQVPWKSKKSHAGYRKHNPSHPPPPSGSSFDTHDTHDHDDKGHDEQDEERKCMLDEKEVPENEKVAEHTASNSSIIGLAHELVDNEFFSSGRRHTSIVNLGLEHLFRNVYQIRA